MFCQVVSAVELPQAIGLVRHPVEEVVPEVQGDGVHAGFEEKPFPRDRRRGFVQAVGEEDV